MPWRNGGYIFIQITSQWRILMKTIRCKQLEIVLAFASSCSSSSTSMEHVLAREGSNKA